MAEIILLTDLLRSNFTASRCKHYGRFTIDPQTGDAFCNDCQSAVSPSHALARIAFNFERIESRHLQLKEEAEALAVWVPTLRAVRNLHRRWKGKKLIPACPHCRKPVEARALDDVYLRRTQ